MAAGISRTVSSVIIVLELTQNLKLLLPMLMCMLLAFVYIVRAIFIPSAVLLATTFGKLFSGSVYDALIAERKLPLLPQFDIYQYSITPILPTHSPALRILNVL